jgi:error-prone DNA polymerase
MAGPAEFTHLHVASSYSLRYGTATPAALAARTADLGMSALALTDRDGLFGAFKHVRACADAGIRPLLGADLALRLDGKDIGGKSQLGRVTLLATGRQGWASLCRLISAAHAASSPARQPLPDGGTRGRTPEPPETDPAPRAQSRAPSRALPGEGDTGTGLPRALGGPRGDHSPGENAAVTRELVAEHSDGLVVLLGPASDVGQAVAARRPDLARRALDRWRQLGVDAVAEIVDHLGRQSTVRAARLAELARDTRTPAVLTNAVRYLDPVDSLTAQVLDAARHLVPLGSPRLAPHNGRAYLAGQEEMAAAAARVAAAMSGPGTASAATLLLGETQELTRRCVLDPARDLGVGARHLPEARGPGLEGTAYGQYRELRDRCEHAILHGRYRTASAASRPRGVSRLRAAELARERFERELDVIAQTGMAAYFLTVADVADRIRQAGIRCAIRGSGAGSFVNHLLGISAIDPLEHGLLMERFLSPVRNTLPDIDLDVESARRLEAYRIIFDAYGADRTACVCMMETYRARSAIRDVAAAMSLPPDEIGAIAKAFPHIRARHITAALTELPELRRSRLNGAQLEAVFGIAQQLDGLPRHVAMHPCGVLLSDRTLLDRTAVRSSGEGFPLSQLDKDDAEIAGVIKLDVLGVRMQSAMAHALAEIGRSGGDRVDIDAVPRDDPATYAMIARGQTLGCFQIESPGQRELVRKLAPRDIADLIVDISLFRPGPVNSDMIGPFLRTRHGLAEPRYPHERLAGALRETGGVVVFHEQVLQVIDAMTGCGLAEADLVRRHLSTAGGPERTAPWFRAQALARGFDPATAEQVWQVVAAFGGFGFCKAHAAAFAVPVYQSAWLRRHHPAAFYAGVLTHDPGMYPKRVIIADARLSGIQVLPVDVNASAGDWIAEAGDRGPAGAGAQRGAQEKPGPVRENEPADFPHAAPPAAQRNRSVARRLLETTGPLQALRFPGRGHLPGGRPPVPPGARAAVPDREDRDHSGPGRTDGYPRVPAAPRAVRCSLREVKGISDAEVAGIVAGQPYTSLRDFWNRAGVSRPVAERLVLLGAFDSLYAAPRDPAGSPVPPRGTRITAHPPGPAPPGPAPLSAAPLSAPNLRVQPGSPSRAPGIPPAGSAGSAGSGSPGTESGPGSWRCGALCQGGPGAVSRSASPSGAGCRSAISGSALGAAAPIPAAVSASDISDMPGRCLAPPAGAPPAGAPALPRPTRRDLLARVGVLARQSPGKRPGPPALDLFAGADPDAADGMADLVPAGQLRDLDLAERVEAELEILGFEVSRHVMSCYAGLLAGLGVVTSAQLADQENGALILVAGAKAATQTPAVRSGQRIIFASLDDAAGLVDLAFFESVQDRCAARLFGSWLVVVRGRVRRAGAGPVAVTVNATECWDLPALEEIRAAAGLDAVRAAMAAGDVGPGTRAGSAVPAAAQAEDLAGLAAAVPDESARPLTFANGFVLSPYAETGAPGGNLKHPSRPLWHASPGSPGSPAP